MLDDLSDLLSKWLTAKRSQQLMACVEEAISEARDKVRASDSPFKSLAQRCIDKAEESYKDAIYSLKDGEPKSCVDQCRQGLKYLAMSVMHLSNLKLEEGTLQFSDDSVESAITDLSQSIARFKSSVEYTNYEVQPETKERVVDAMRLHADAIRLFRKSDDSAACRVARAGTLSMYLIGRQFEDKLGSTIVERAALDRLSGSAAARIIDLAEQLAKTQAMLGDTSEASHGRIKVYLDAAQRTTEQCIASYLDDDEEDVAKMAKAGVMELRMAKRLIDYSKYPQKEEDPEFVEIDTDQETSEFKRRVVRLQRLLKGKEEEAVLRRLGLVCTYYARSRSLFKSANYSEAERYARSAHLDLDFSRQLLFDKHANYSSQI